MIVAAWFTIVFFIILVGFGIVIATFVHWWKQSKIKARAAAATAADSANSHPS